MKNNLYFSEIQSLQGLEPLKELISRWQHLSENIDLAQNGRGPLLPDLLWICDAGIDEEHLLNLLTAFLYTAQNLQDFYGNVRNLDYYPDYVTPDKECHEIDKLGEKIRDAAGFRSEFRGILTLDVSEWVGHFTEEHFVDLIKYLTTMDEYLLIIFRVPNYDPAACRQLYEILGLFFRIEPLSISLPDSTELVAHICRKVSEYGLSLDESGAHLLLASVDRLRTDRYFAGYPVLNRIAADIVYFVLTATLPPNGIITGEMLAMFAPDGPYIAQLIQNNQRIFTSQYAKDAQ